MPMGLDSLVGLRIGRDRAGWARGWVRGIWVGLGRWDVGGVRENWDWIFDREVLISGRGVLGVWGWGWGFGLGVSSCVEFFLRNIAGGSSAFCFEGKII